MYISNQPDQVWPSVILLVHCKQVQPPNIFLSDSITLQQLGLHGQTAISVVMADWCFLMCVHCLQGNAFMTTYDNLSVQVTDLESLEEQEFEKVGLIIYLDWSCLAGLQL